MGDCVNLSLNSQTFQTSAVVIGSKPGRPAVQGLTVYGDISASGRIHSADSGMFKMSFAGNGGHQYGLPYYPSPNAQDYFVSVDGILQEAGKSFFISSGGVMTFTENIPATSRIMVLTNRSILANSTNVPSFKKNFYIAQSNQTSYTLAYYSNDNASNYLVYIDGVMQSPLDDYYINEDKIIFTDAPITGQKILVMSLQNQDGTYAAMVSEEGTINLQLSCIPVPAGSLNSHVLTYNSTNKTWQGQYVLPVSATNGQVLTYDSSQQKWLANTTNVLRGGGIVIRDLPGASTWNVPSNVGSIKVHVIGGGGGIGVDGGDSIFNVTVNSIPVVVTAKGGERGTINVGGKGGNTLSAAPIPAINFTGVGNGIGGTGGTLRTKGGSGTGNGGGYGGGGGGGAGGFGVLGSMPVGTICWYPLSAPPNGFLECNGAVLSQTVYSELYSVIGTKFNTGGEASGNFRLPDLRGEFIRGWDNEKGVDVGRIFGSKQTDEFKSHFHQTPTWNGVTGVVGQYELSTNTQSQGYDYGTQSAPTDSKGGAETRPRNIALLPCIKGSSVDATNESPGGGGGGSGIGGGGGGSSSGVGGSGSGYGSSGNSDANWGEKSGGYGGGATSAGYCAGGGGGYAVFSLDVTPGSNVNVVVGSGGTGGSGGRPGAVIIEW